MIEFALALLSLLLREFFAGWGGRHPWLRLCYKVNGNAIWPKDGKAVDIVASCDHMGEKNICVEIPQVPE